jgi:hypothetical protein
MAETLNFATLEIAISKEELQNYRVEMRFQPHNALEEPKYIREYRYKEPSYGDDVGASVTQWLVGSDAMRDFVLVALAAANQQDTVLRIRIILESSASELHRIPWERMRDPAAVEPLIGRDRILLSRHLRDANWWEVRLPPRGRMSALLVRCNPESLMGAGSELAPVDVPLDGIRAVLPDLERRELLADPAGGVRVTRERLLEELRKGADILLLVCHGKLDVNPDEGRQETYLLLEHDDGSDHWVSTSELTTLINGLTRRPSIVVLSACRSAGAPGGEGQLASLAVRLAEVGIPVVLGMQDNVGIDTARDFMTTFFGTLSKTGNVELATAAARTTVRRHSDAWAPVLFSRLLRGAVWHEPGLGAGQRFDAWEGLISNLRNSAESLRSPELSIEPPACVPILGFGVGEAIMGSPQRIARQWAKKRAYPLARHGANEFAQVAEYLKNKQEIGHVWEVYRAAIRDQILKEYGEKIANAEKAPLPDLIRTASGYYLDDPQNPYSILARLPVALYVTAMPDRMLEYALEHAGRKPVTDFFRWSEDLASLQGSAWLAKPGAYQGTRECPLVYHMFGLLDIKTSLVLTEEDCFEYLVQVGETERKVGEAGSSHGETGFPSAVQAAFSGGGLLFLGCQADDWRFRLLFRVLSRKRRLRHQPFKSIIVQVRPDDTAIDPERALLYFEQLFQTAKISTYWGSASDFLAELWGMQKEWLD